MRRLFVVLLPLLVFAVYTAQAQEADLSSSIARTYAVADEEAEAGDIVALDEESGAYRLARPGDVLLVGVIVSDPLIVFEDDEEGLPVVRDGEVLVNVSDIGGTISVGSLIGPSPIPGKGQRVQNGTPAIGVAREAFLDATTTITVGGTEVGLGTVRVLLGGTPAEAVGTGVAQPTPFAPVEGTTVPQAFKYIMALLIGVGSVYISFRSFGSNIRTGIISIGRNPLAKTSIQAMVILNIVLVVLVAGGGLLLSIAILLLPF